VWTRTLFLDRSHARARAYIERARSALAERQREADELLQKGIAAFNRSDTEEARRLLMAAVAAGAPTEDALAVLQRLDRLESGDTRSRTDVPRGSRSAVVKPTAIPGRGAVVLWIGLGAVVAG